MTLLEARGLTYSYPGGVLALDGLDLKVTRGRRLGHPRTERRWQNHLAFAPQRHAATGIGTGFPGRRSRRLFPRRAIGLAPQVGLVLQDADDQLFAASVAEDVSFGPLNLGLSEHEARLRVEEALAALTLPAWLRGRLTCCPLDRRNGSPLPGAVAMQPDVL